MVIAALNIESLASALGIDKLLTSDSPVVSAVATVLLSREVLYIALFAAGGGAFAWGSYIFRKMDEGVPGMYSLSLTCEQLANEYEGKTLLATKAFIDRYMKRNTERLNAKLALLDIAPVPLPDMSSIPSRLHVSQYLNALLLHFRKKDLDGARRAADLYLKNLEAVGFVPRPPPNIEADTRS